MIDKKEIQSRNIDFLRFPMIVGIVCIHARFSSNEMELLMTHNNSLEHTQHLFGEILASISVPLYYIISGYLFFYSLDVLDRSIYFKKLKKRAKTLLVPYIIWNFIAFCIYLIDHSFSFKTFVSSFFVVDVEGRGGSSPMDGPLWFIRNLYIVMVLSPVTYWLCKRYKGYWLLPLLILWIVGLSPFTKGIVLAFVFFSVGSYLSISKKFLVIDKYSICIIGFLITVVLCFFNVAQNKIGFIISRFNIIWGIFACLAVATFVSKRFGEKKGILEFLGSVSFFIYCCHDLLLPTVKDGTLRCFSSLGISHTGWLYISVILIDVSLCILLYLTFKLLLKNRMWFLTGGR